MSRWARHPVLGVALLAVVTSGCAVKVAGAPTPETTLPSSTTREFEDPARVQAADALGDLPKLNPCSIVDPEKMPEEWDVEQDVPAAFEYCLVTVTTDDGVEADVEVGYLYRASHDVEEHPLGKRDGGITIVPAEAKDNSCLRDIVFADGIALEVRAWPYEDDNAGKMCAIADKTADLVLEEIMAGKAQSLELPENSLGELDPCELVTSEMVAAIPGMTAGIQPDQQTSQHSCWWETDGPVTLSVHFEIGRLPSGDSGSTVQNRYTTVFRFEDTESSSLCSVDGEHVPFKHLTVSGLMERVGIYVYQAPGQVEQACGAASALADKLWAKLPPLK